MSEVIIIGLDIAKHVFHVGGADEGEHDAAMVDVPAEPASAAPVVKRSAGN